MNKDYSQLIFVFPLPTITGKVDFLQLLIKNVYCNQGKTAKLWVSTFITGRPYWHSNTKSMRIRMRLVSKIGWCLYCSDPLHGDYWHTLQGTRQIWPPCETTLLLAHTKHKWYTDCGYYYVCIWKQWSWDWNEKQQKAYKIHLAWVKYFALKYKAILTQT